MKKALLIALLASTTAIAQTSTTTAPADQSGTSKMKAGEATQSADRKDIDDEITNARMRATTGSKSKWSVATSFGYTGSTIEKPFEEHRPRLMQGTSTVNTSIDGAVSVKYRLNDHNNLNAGIGVTYVTPGYSDQKWNVDTPFVAWSHVGKLGNLQSVVSAQFSYYSTDEYRGQGNNLDYNVDLSHTILGSVGVTGLEVGIAYGINNDFYTDGPFAGDVKGGSTRRTDYTLAAYPFMEYAFNDMFSFRTVYRGLSFIHFRDEDAGQFRHVDPTQSVGVGMALTRDIYLYPNVQWVWGDIRADKTNVALSTNINLF